MKNSILLTLCICAVALAAGPEYELAFPETVEQEKPLFAAVQLDGDMLANLGGHCEWLRLKDKDGTVVPWRLAQATYAFYETVVENVPIAVSSLLNQPDGSLELIFSVTPDVALPEKATLVFQTQMKDFQQQIAVWGKGKNQADWKLLLEDGIIFDSSANLNIRNIQVEFSPAEARNFKVIIQNASLDKTDAFHKILKTTDANGGEATEDAFSVNVVPFKMDGVELKILRIAPEPVLRSRWQMIQADFQKIECSKEGVSRYEVRPPLCPIAALVIEGNDSNYSRRVNVYRNAKTLRRLASADILSIAMGTKGILSNRVPFDWTETTPFVIEFEDNDNPPFNLKNVMLESPLNEIFFVMEPAKAPYTLFAEPDASMPNYDTAHLVESQNMKAERIQPGRFSGERLDPALYPDKDRDRNITHTMMMTAILLVTIILVACVALTVRRI